ncbi:AlkA N-terminal domain-containing protein [Pseudoalteromonas sp. B193]
MRNIKEVLPREFMASKNHFSVSINIDNTACLQPVINSIRRVLDLDADINLD